MKRIDVVTSYYDDYHKFIWKEDLNKFDYNLVLYKKDDSLNKEDLISIYDFILHDDEISIPNYGKCEFAFFHYIVHNYYNLPDFVVFTKINWHEYNFDGNFINFDELLTNCFKYDFINVRKF